MSPIYTLYWSSFRLVFVFLAITLTIVLASAFIKRVKENKLIALALWGTSFSSFITVIFVSYFSGILYDELNIPTDNLILFLMGYASIVFIVHTGYFLFTLIRKKKYSSVNSVGRGYYL